MYRFVVFLSGRTGIIIHWLWQLPGTWAVRCGSAAKKYNLGSDTFEMVKFGWFGVQRLLYHVYCVVVKIFTTWDPQNV